MANVKEDGTSIEHKMPHKNGVDNILQGHYDDYTHFRVGNRFGWIKQMNKETIKRKQKNVPRVRHSWARAHTH